MRINATIVTLAATIMLAGCGSGNDLDTADLSVNGDDSEVKLALGAENPAAADEYTLLASFPSKPEAAAFCTIINSACKSGSEITVSYASTMNGREIYSATSASRIDVNAIMAIRYSIGGVVKVRKFRISAAGVTSPETSPVGAMTWKALLATGDNEFKAWDNARKKLTEQFAGRGIKPENMKLLSMDTRESIGAIAATSKENIRSALGSLTSSSNPNEACLIFMTSHGTPQGFFLRNKGTISPTEFAGYVDATCGKRPTVVIVSACYSGVMLNTQIKTPNRIVFTAAQADRTSFGCDAHSTYTFFDECVIKTLPSASNWKNFGESNTKCVNDLERQRGITTHSNPQTFIGADVVDLKLP